MGRSNCHTHHYGSCRRDAVIDHPAGNSTSVDRGRRSVVSMRRRPRHGMVMRGVALSLIVAGCTTSPARNSASEPAASSPPSRPQCRPQVPERGPLPEPYRARFGTPTPPWLDGGKFVAILMYSTGSSDIGTHGVMPDGRRTKILWMTAERPRKQVLLNGVLERDKSVMIYQDLPGTQDFPSIVDVPEPGCWTFTLLSGSENLGSISLMALPNGNHSSEGFPPEP